MRWLEWDTRLNRPIALVAGDHGPRTWVRLSRLAGNFTPDEPSIGVSRRYQPAGVKFPANA
jgi:hypothetical protein